MFHLLSVKTCAEFDRQTVLSTKHTPPDKHGRRDTEETEEAKGAHPPDLSSRVQLTDRGHRQKDKQTSDKLTDAYTTLM